MPEVAIVIHRHAADVHIGVAGLDRNEDLFFAGESVVYLQHGGKNESAIEAKVGIIGAKDGGRNKKSPERRV